MKNPMTADERLAAAADKLGITVEAIKTHTRKTAESQQALWQAKQDGATDNELVALATGGTP
ncbi:hypothetical protein LCGC14_2113300 [marine sediment metagenome]|uniref:Uncharacterized protein n=1 Tax=marine sediment metagenome TaxID=412755 RepID=A0A0F9H2P6_9ZZZZ